MQEAKKGVSHWFAAENGEGDGGQWSKGLQIRVAKTAGASKTIEVEVDKPLGLTLGQKSGGGVVITVSFFIGFVFAVTWVMLLL